MILGIDTSCYTTSAAVCDKSGILCDARKVLEVPAGGRGLRQSEALFQHIKNLPLIMKKVGESIDLKQLDGVIVSRTPRPADGSYMPVFTAGCAVAESVAAALKVPVYYTSHQEGHIMAALYSCGCEVKDNEFVSVHISGGTTEILRTVRTEKGFDFEICARSLDLHAGQLIDRLGVSLGMKFPCGSELDSLAFNEQDGLKMPVTLKGADIHFSGAESYMKKYLEEGRPKEKIARGLIEAIGKSLVRSLDYIYNEKPFETVIMGGGVSASRTLRQTVKSDKYKILFADARYSTDNACGTALIGEFLR